ncbi:MAG: DNA-directed RNA polymerase subunit delta [Methylocystaceae bacterium]
MAGTRKNDAEVACEILREQTDPMHYRNLLSEILVRQGREVTDENMAAVYTRLNMDHELICVGNGFWDVRNR